MLYQRIKEETNSAHRALEKQLIMRIKKIKSLADYSDLLKLMYGYYASVEGILEKYLRCDPDINFEERRKAAWLMDDITNLGYKTGGMLLCSDLPSVTSHSTALGVMYVLEGSTLGGQFIAQIIKTQLNIETDTGFRFFINYGNQRQIMWDEFKENLEKPYNATEQLEMLKAADNTFITFSNWVDTYAVN